MPRAITSYDEQATERQAEQVVYYTRALARQLAGEGFEREDKTVPLHDGAYRDASHKLKIWCLDSLIWAFEQWARGRYVEAFRGYVQAEQYKAQLAFWPGPMASDAGGALRNLVEDMIETGTQAIIAGAR